MRILLVAVIAMMVGCATIDTQSMAQRMATQYSVLKYIDESPQKAERVVSRVDNIIAIVEKGDGITFAVVIDRVNSNINWNNLDTADTLLVKTLLLELQNDLGGRIGQGVLNQEDKANILAVLNWIRNAALMAN